MLVLLQALPARILLEFITRESIRQTGAPGHLKFPLMKRAPNRPAAQLLALTNYGVIIDETSNKFRMDEEKPKNVSMFSLTNATFWTADMDIDSDGREAAWWIDSNLDVWGVA
jgi:hypothetical protein